MISIIIVLYIPNFAFPSLVNNILPDFTSYNPNYRNYYNKIVIKTMLQDLPDVCSFENVDEQDQEH